MLTISNYSVKYIIMLNIMLDRKLELCKKKKLKIKHKTILDKTFEEKTIENFNKIN